MRQLSWKSIVMVAGIAALTSACGRNSQVPLDDALKHDLALASQSQPYNPQQTMSPYEAGYAAQPQRYAARPTSAPVFGIARTTG